MPVTCWIQNNTHTTSKKAFRISPSPAINSPHQLPVTSLLRNHIAFRNKAVFIVDIYINIYKKSKTSFRDCRGLIFIFYRKKIPYTINPLNPELNPICYLLASLGAHHFLHVNRIRVKSLTLRLLMSYIYGAPILDVSRSHTTTQHSR